MSFLAGNILTHCYSINMKEVPGDGYVDSAYTSISADFKARLLTVGFYIFKVVYPYQFFFVF